MRHDSDNFAPLSLRRPNAIEKALPHGGFRRKSLGGERLIDDDHVPVGRIVRLREGASGDERGAHGFEVAGQNDLQVRGLKSCGIRQGFHGTPAHRAETAGKRHGERGGHTPHAGNRGQPVMKLAHESRARLRRVAEVAEELKRHEVVRVESHIHLLNGPKGSKHQARSDQQNETESDFDHHHGIAEQSSAAEAGGSPAGPQNADDFGTRRPHGGHQAKQSGGGESQQSREGQHRGIDA